MTQSLLSFVVGMLFSTRLAAAETASVTIVAVSPFGEILSPVKVTRFAADNGRGRDYSPLFTGARADRILTGRYMAQVEAGGRRMLLPFYVGRKEGLIVVSGPEKIIETGPGLHGVIGKV